MSCRYLTHVNQGVFKMEIFQEVPQEAAESMADQMLNKIQELQDVLNVLQPLLFAVSKALYGESTDTISLAKLVEDGVALLSTKE